MTYWKLGCRWDSNNPLFFDFIKKNEIVVGWLDHPYAVGDWLLLTDGFEVLGFAQAINNRQQVINFPQYQAGFNNYKIPFTKDLYVSKAKFIELKKEDRFIYKLQPGIRKIGKREVIETFKTLLAKYLISQNIKEMEEVLYSKKQIILQGPPGTGKTYTAKNIAYKMIFNEDLSHQIEDRQVQLKRLEQSEQFKLVQFHPSYTYEDFVRGIVALSKGDQIEYKNVNKTLGLFAKEALKNHIKSKKVPELISKENWVEENYLKFKEDLEKQLQEGGEIIIKEKTKPKIIAIEEDALRVNRYTYEKDSILVKDTDIIDGYIGLNLTNHPIKVKENFSLSKSARSGMYYLYQNLIEKFSQFLKSKNKEFKIAEDLKPEVLKKFILVIDEINRANLSSVLGELIYALEYRGEAVESMYAVDDDTKLILPPNLFIIGTMNTSDRSVGHIDYAIRRRFAFIDVLPRALDINTFQLETFKTISTLFIKNLDAYLLDNNVVLEKSEHLSEEFNPKDVWLGHSYFIATYEEFDIRKKYEIKPILEEYVKDGILKKSAESIINGL